MHRVGWLLGMWLWVSPAFASIEITVHRTEPILAADRLSGQCNVEIRGEIENGDTERLAAILAPLETVLLEGRPYWGQHGDGFNICLASEGGSFAEGVRMARFFIEHNIVTLIKRGEQCLSACAVAFFGGTIFVDGRHAARAVEPRATLGVHMPALPLEDNGALLPVAVAIEAYNTAVRSIGELSDVLLRQQGSRPGMPPNLFVELVSTPPGEMFYVETVQHYYNWGVQLIGAEFNVPINDLTLTRVCSALLSSEPSADDMSELTYFSFDTDARPYSMMHPREIQDPRARRGEVAMQVADPMMGGLSPSSCTFIYPRPSTHIQGTEITAYVHWQNMNQDRVYYGFPTYLAFPLNTPIASLVW